MVFGLTIGTERATSLQKSIQDELIKRGYSTDADPVMAEYITIMIINNKTPAQVTTELEDLIGSDYDPTFTDWLFVEAAKGAPESEVPSQPQPSTSTQPVPQPQPVREPLPHVPTEPASRRPPNGPRAAGVYQQAITQALPSQISGHKRTASARSPSPAGHTPNKSRRTDLPTGPRAMQRDSISAPANSRSLLDRVGGPANRANGGAYHRDDIQARIDNITSNSPDPSMMMSGFPNGMPMDMAASMPMANPLLLQEMMMNQMAMMAQMATSMGMLNPPNQFMPGAGGVPAGFPMQQDMGMFPGGMNGFQGPPQRGRGIGRGGRGSGRGRGSAPSTSGGVSHTDVTSPSVSEQQASAEPIVAPTPVVAPANTATVLSTSVAPPVDQTRAGFVPPERPQSPTLCKFGLKCTNPSCRFSHPSPVATAESGVVLSNEACEKGKDCKDKDCVKAHVSPAVLNPEALKTAANLVGHPAVFNAAPVSSPARHPPPAPSPHAVPCRYGTACTRPNCPYSHPVPQKAAGQFAQPCRFGAGCTRATCPYQHPEGRVLPTAFHRGLSTTAPIVNVPTPETGSMSGNSHNRSVTFNKNDTSKESLEKKMKELEEKKSEAEKAVRDAEAAAAKKDESKAVAITA